MALEARVYPYSHLYLNILTFKQSALSTIIVFVNNNDNNKFAYIHCFKSLSKCPGTMMYTIVYKQKF